MADYIRREDAIKTAEHAYYEWNLAMAAADGKREINLVYKRQELCKAVESVFRDTPAADVAPVVRCKDCAKHYIVLGRDMCAKNAQGSEGHWIGLSATVPDGFCHRGVHK